MKAKIRYVALVFFLLVNIPVFAGGNSETLSQKKATKEILLSYAEYPI